MEDLGASDPRTLGRYRPCAVLGEGGMGRVLLATGPHGNLVAIKQVHEHLADDLEFRKRFRREVFASRKVVSARTAAVVDADPDARVPWLASEFVYGPPLRKALADLGPLPAESVLRLAAGLATALEDIHRAGLVHRDLSPSNVLLADHGPMVIDFGIVRAVEGHQATTRRHTVTMTVTSVGVVVGAPGFMSPEQAEGRELTAASDVFSLGTLLLVASTGSNPFEGPGIPQTLYNVVHATPDLGALPRRLRRVVKSCLAKDPRHRPGPAEIRRLVGPLPETDRPWPAPVHHLTERQRAEVRARVPRSEDTTATVPLASPDTLRIGAGPPPSRRGRPPAPTPPPTPAPPPAPRRPVSGAGAVPPPARPPSGRPRPAGPPSDRPPSAAPSRRPRRPRRRRVLGLLVAAVALALVGLASAVHLTDGGGGVDTPAATPTVPDDAAAPSPRASAADGARSDAVAGAVAGDCFANDGTMAAMDLRPTDCKGGAFQAVRVIHDSTDTDDCGSVTADWSVAYPGRRTVLCLNYLHPNGSAYHAATGDCVYGPRRDGSVWEKQDCRTGNFTVVARVQGRSTASDCDGEEWQHSRYFTVERWPELNVRLCLRMNYPDDVGRAEVDSCLLMTGTEPDLRFAAADCGRANVVVTGRTDRYHDRAFCGNHGWTTWRPSGFPELAYTVCFRRI